MVKHFRTPEKSLGDLDTPAAAALVSAAADIVIVLDGKGKICDLAIQEEDLADGLADLSSWIGKYWFETATVESREKIESLFKEAANSSVSRWGQINHAAISGTDIPVLYSVVQVSRDRFVSVGRDLRPLSLLQQRLVDAQHSLERDYSRLRHVEMRYRLLFELSSEALVMLSTSDLRIVDANPAARRLLGGAERRIVGRSFLQSFDTKTAESVRLLLTNVQVAGRDDGVQAQLAQADREVAVTASIMRQEDSTLFLVRIVPTDTGNAVVLPKLKTKLLKIVENAPDAVLVTDTDGRILSANGAFLEMAQLASQEQALGEKLDRWIGRTSVDLDVLFSSLRRHGLVRLFGTTMRPDFGSPNEVEISAVSVMNGGQPCFGITIRNVSRRLTAESGEREVPRSMEQLKELIGRVSLKQLVRETTDVIERRCIEAALDLTGDNRASAAEMLGLSRQSLYVKLRRHGLAIAGEE